jgi:HIRAN domain-containing protein
MDIFLVALLLVAGSAAWFFYKKQRRVAPITNQTILRLHGGGTYDVGLVGTSRYRPALEKLCEVDQQEPRIVDALLVLDDNNVKDKNAVRVEVQGRQIGYLAPELAEAYRRRLVEGGYPGARSTCKAKIMPRMHSSLGHRGDYSIRLDLPQKRAAAKGSTANVPVATS